MDLYLKKKINTQTPNDVDLHKQLSPKYRYRLSIALNVKRSRTLSLSRVNPSVKIKDANADLHLRRKVKQL